MTITVDKSNDKNIIESLNPSTAVNSTAVNINIFSNEKDTDDNNSRKLVCDIITNVKIINEKEEYLHKHTQMNNDKEWNGSLIYNKWKQKQQLLLLDNSNTDELTIEIDIPTTSTNTNLSNYIHLLHPIINNFYTTSLLQ